MKIIVAGSRNITDYAFVRDAMIDSGLWKKFRRKLQIVSGRAKGVDKLGELFAKRNKLICHWFRADWNNLNVPGAVISKRKDGTEFNARAGLDRNMEMGDFADMLVAIWDGESRGTAQMISYMSRLGKPVYLHNTKTGEKKWLN